MYSSRESHIHMNGGLFTSNYGILSVFVVSLNNFETENGTVLYNRKQTYINVQLNVFNVDIRNLRKAIFANNSVAMRFVETSIAMLGPDLFFFISKS